MASGSKPRVQGFGFRVFGGLRLRVWIVERVLDAGFRKLTVCALRVCEERQ